MDLNSPPTPRRSSILRRSSLVTTEIGLALTQYTTQVFSRTTISLSVHYYPSLEKTKSHPLPLLLVLQASTKICSHLANTTGSFALFSQDYKPLTLRLVTSTTLLFVPDKVPLPSNPPPGTEPKSGGVFCLTAKEVLRRKNNNLCTYCGSKDHLLPACPLSRCSSFVKKSSTLTSLSLIDTFKSPTVLVTIHGPLGKIKVLSLLDTGANANFIEEKLAKLIGISASGSLDVKVGNSTIIGATPTL
ncbi:Retrotransposon-derived protein peg10 [Entomophthora muscae]|uniref:Retrotransposon-derived protein peg10 n=1 Tax=Entomophthora muscae TaxID=34485 RepID=A0ACC2U4G1_9FUNG|nr:Retrotransposon-derived protein peg10 [Entomophthora muscae]